VLLKTARRTQKSRPLEVFGEQFQCAGRAKCRNKELIWLTRVSQIKRRQPTDLACQTLSLLGKVGRQSENVAAFWTAHVSVDALRLPCLGICCQHPGQEAAGDTVDASPTCGHSIFVRLQQANSREFGELYFSPTTPEPYRELRLRLAGVDNLPVRQLGWYVYRPRADQTQPEMLVKG